MRGFSGAPSPIHTHHGLSCAIDVEEVWQPQTVFRTRLVDIKLARIHILVRATPIIPCTVSTVHYVFNATVKCCSWFFMIVVGSVGHLCED